MRGSMGMTTNDLTGARRETGNPVFVLSIGLWSHRTPHKKSPGVSQNIVYPENLVSVSRFTQSTISS